ncbi:MAG: rhodanese-like domain-containing protein [Sphingobacteriales bacterium]|nr:MAG: rhodanese-like domain-containing protein [Sphingobacteriales bacterium]
MLDFFKHIFAKAEYDLDGEDFYKKFLEDGGNAVLLDVRTQNEYAMGTIKGSKNIDFYSNTFQDKINALDKNKTYYVFCRSGNRSGKACQLMTDKGMKAFNLDGGIGAWPG